MVKVVSLVALFIVASTAKVRADNTPSGIYVAESIAPMKPTGEAPGSPRCDKHFNRPDAYKPDDYVHTKISYAKTAHRVIVGSAIFDFVTDDGTAVTANFEHQGLLITVHFGLAQEGGTSAIFQVSASAVEDKQIVCTNVYRYLGHRE